MACGHSHVFLRADASDDQAGDSVDQILSGEIQNSYFQRPITDLGQRFRADAKAEGQVVGIGGWETITQDTPTSKARWFALELDKTNASWAFSKGEPFKTIAALELFASLLCVRHFVDDLPPRSHSTMQLSGLTDNKGNSCIVTKLMSTKFPLFIILMELAHELDQKGITMGLSWIPRDQNCEAGDLSNLKADAFDPALRITPLLGAAHFPVMHEMLSAAEALQSAPALAPEAQETQGDTPVVAPKVRSCRQKSLQPGGLSVGRECVILAACVYHAKNQTHVIRVFGLGTDSAGSRLGVGGWVKPACK